MKGIVLVAILALALAHIDNEEIYKQVKEADTTWEPIHPAHYPFKGYTEEELKEMMGTDLTHLAPDHEEPIQVPDMTAVPTTFDSRVQWPKCVHKIMDQAKCGSCWAFGASESLSDRFCIAGVDEGPLSPQNLVSCDKWNMGCKGGNLFLAMSYLKNHGIPTVACEGYTSGAGVNGKCPTACDDGSKMTLYKAKTYTHVRGEAAIMKEISTNGPVEGAFTVYQDFMTYKSGVYAHTTGSALGGHAIKILGYGEENGTPYWLCANSWNATWGDEGFFKIKRGDCGIDGNVYAATPAL